MNKYTCNYVYNFASVLFYATYVIKRWRMVLLTATFTPSLTHHTLNNTPHATIKPPQNNCCYTHIKERAQLHCFALRSGRLFSLACWRHRFTGNSTHTYLYIYINILIIQCRFYIWANYWRCKRHNSNGTYLSNPPGTYHPPTQIPPH
jgi:hypothetical protein